ncbi:MAG: FoF1 ATP synthase subunit gamma [Bacteroidia bacterium]|nr:FoF1 ATP synthase subunit gamma [Bacteroidia bacterium]
MSSLREIKDRIGSVRGTLKITSAMKLVASAKLRKAQRTIESLLPYEQELDSILHSLLSSGNSPRHNPCPPSDTSEGGTRKIQVPEGDAGDCGRDGEKRSGTEGLLGESCPRSEVNAVVVISSNSSLCGGFNANVVKKALEVINGSEGAVEVIAVGRKAAEAMKKAGFAQNADYSDVIGHPEYEKSAALARGLMERFNAGELGRVVLVYNHFVNGATQTPVAETYLPFSYEPEVPETELPEDLIIEPEREEILKTLLPQVITLKFHTAILDSAAAEHAARTMAMQTATDNAEDLLSELTLEYNKGRQQKITAEILDLLGGAAK